ncbi:MAG: ABC transporter permease subunit [Rhodospirillales bacterium]|nr:ABC transporter permease subunit [Rhodospirillales bacterium]
MITKIPIGGAAEQLVAFVGTYLKPLVITFIWITLSLNGAFFWLFQSLPAPAWIIGVAIVAWRFAGPGIAIFGLLGLGLLWNQGLWGATAQTLSLVLTGTLMSLVVAIPLGIAMAESRVVNSVMAPILDFLQTMPRFVYLIPAVAILGLDVAPAVFATMTLAVPPPTRLTAVGIGQVDPRMVEAAEAFGSTRWQILAKIKLPLAFSAIMLGVNQCLMMSLSMVIIASLIGAGGLGAEILKAISEVKAGRGLVAGIGVVVLAILIDRITKGAAARLTRRWGRDTVMQQA